MSGRPKIERVVKRGGRMLMRKECKARQYFRRGPTGGVKDEGDRRNPSRRVRPEKGRGRGKPRGRFPLTGNVGAV